MRYFDLDYRTQISIYVILHLSPPCPLMARHLAQFRVRFIKGGFYEEVSRARRVAYDPTRFDTARQSRLTRWGGDKPPHYIYIDLIPTRFISGRVYYSVVKEQVN